MVRGAAEELSPLSLVATAITPFHMGGTISVEELAAFGAAAEPELERRLALLAEAEALMLEQQPVMPIYFYVSRRLVKPWVRGWLTGSFT